MKEKENDAERGRRKKLKERGQRGGRIMNWYQKVETCMEEPKGIITEENDRKRKKTLRRGKSNGAMSDNVAEYHLVHSLCPSKLGPVAIRSGADLEAPST